MWVFLDPFSEGLGNLRKFARNWSSGVTSRCRSPTGHVDPPDSALDGHSVERGWPGSPVRTSPGLVCLDGRSAFRNKAFLFLAVSPLSSFYTSVRVPRGFSCHGQGEQAVGSVTSCPSCCEQSSHCCSHQHLEPLGTSATLKSLSLVAKTLFGCQNAFFWSEISLYLPKSLAKQLSYFHMLDKVNMTYLNKYWSIP